MSASVIPSSEGGLVRVSGAANVRTNVTVGGAERKNITRLLDATSSQLQTMLEQDPSGAVQAQQAAAPQAVSLADELVKLTALRDAGALSPTEFEAAKSRLLG